MSKVTQELKAVFNRLNDFLNIFDLSFFISGSVCFMGIVYFKYLKNIKIYFKLTGWLKVFIIILSCYVLGLISFALGRLIRKKVATFFRINRNKSLKNAINNHDLNNAEFVKPYLKLDEEKSKYLYIFLWTKLRQTEELTPSLVHINRYWVMTATYDGLGIALMLWGTIFASKSNFLVSGFLFILVLVCFYEAMRLEKYQLEELVATLAYLKKQ